MLTSMFDSTSQAWRFSYESGATSAGVLWYTQSARASPPPLTGNWEYGTKLVPGAALCCSCAVSPSPTSHTCNPFHVTAKLQQFNCRN